MIAVLETLAIVAPFGVQLRCEGTGAAVSRDLAVTLADPAGRYRPEPVRPNRSNVFAAHRLPGISQVDLRQDDWAALARPMRIEVSDRSGQYLPMLAIATLPVRGLVTQGALVSGSPPAAPSPFQADFLPLFPSPAFTGPGPLAQVRVELSHLDGTPAAWALVIVEIGGASYRGVADERGVGLVAFAWPRRPPPMLPGSPPALASYRWDVSVRAYCDRLPADRPPDLAALLAQAAGPALALTPAGSPPPSPPEPPTLIFARTLNLPPAVLTPA